MNKSLSESIKNLEELFDIFNQRLYNSELEKPIISIQLDKTGKAYGWCTTYKAWQTTDGKEYYEINMCAEYMTRSFEETCGTLIHEMAHLYNLMHDIKDCNKQYHNGKFKKTAEEHGLIVEKTKYGWSNTQLNDEMKDFIKNLNYSFDIARKAETKIKGKAKTKKYHSYMCPCCNAKIYSVSLLNVECNDCGMSFIEY